MKLTLLSVLTLLIASAAFAHDGDVVLPNGDVRVGNYKLISISNVDALLLSDTTCDVEMDSQVLDPNSQRPDSVDVSSCYPSNRYAILSIDRLSEEHQIGGYGYLLNLELANDIPRFPLNAYDTENHATAARCTQVQSRLTCSVLGGGTIILDLR